MGTGWQRARTTEQIEKRRRQILDAARTLFLQQGYDAVSLNGIGRQAGMAKANIYKYFASKEDLYLTLYLALLGTWRDMLLAKLSARPPSSASELAAALTEHTLAHESFLALNAVLATELLGRASEGTLRQYEAEMVLTVERLREVLRLGMNRLDERRVRELVTLLQVVAAGRWHTVRPSEAQAAVWAEAGVARPDVRVELKRVLTVQLTAYEKQI